MRRLFKFFRDIRSRPRHERAILAGITYVTAAAVVVAFWITSFETSLNFETRANPTPPSSPLPKTPSAPEVPPELATPFQSLGEGIRSRLEALAGAVPEKTEPAPEKSRENRAGNVERAARRTHRLSPLGGVLRYNLALLKDGLVSFYRYWIQ